VAGIAAENRMVARLSSLRAVMMASGANNYIAATTVVAAARADADFGPLARSPYWRLLRKDPGQRFWTDDYSNVLGAIVRKLEE